MEGTMMTVEEFIESHGISADVEPADSNPNMVGDGDWARTAYHWAVTLRVPDRGEMTVPFSQGSAHTEPPTAADVLDALASDATFLDSGEEMPGSVARTIIQQSDELAELLGDAAMDDLLYNTERL